MQCKGREIGLVAVWLLIFAPSARAADSLAAASEAATVAADAVTFSNLGTFEDFADLSLDELLNAQVSVASGATTTLRKSPAIVTLITREQILNSGARDLADIFRLVPGLDTPYDVYGTQGISVRGVYAFEGKVLLLLDGIPLNEYQYTTAQYNYHVAVEQIERIEIIRGPGSVVYGGYAALAVINIVTQHSEQQAGAQAFLSAGSYETAFGHIVGGTSYAHTFSSGLGLRVAATGAYANASDGTYTDFYGSSFSVPGNNVFRPWMARLGLVYKGFEAEALYDQYDTLERDQYGDVVLDGPLPNNFRQSAARVRYDWGVNSKLRISPSYLFQAQKPWLATGPRADQTGNAYDIDTWRNTVGLRAEATPLELLHILLGTEYYWEHHRNNLESMAVGTNQMDFNDLSGFGQLEVNWKSLSLIGGARYEWHDAVGGAFVPRAAFGFVWGEFHSKLLYARAFRTPSLMNISSNPAIESEIVDTYEAELGYQLPPSGFVTVNGFVSDIDKPIVYGTDSAGYGNYYNYPRTGTWGLETQIRLTLNRSYVSASHTFSRPLDNKIPTYHYGVTSKRLLGETDHKFTMDGSAGIWRGLTINPSAIVYGRRDGFVNATQTKTFGPSLLLNGFIRYAGLAHETLELGLGVYNITDDQTPYSMAYQSWHAPFPVRGREYVARIGYRL